MRPKLSNTHTVRGTNSALVPQATGADGRALHLLQFSRRCSVSTHSPIRAQRYATHCSGKLRVAADVRLLLNLVSLATVAAGRAELLATEHCLSETCSCPLKLSVGGTRTISCLAGLVNENGSRFLGLLTAPPSGDFNFRETGATERDPEAFGVAKVQDVGVRPVLPGGQDVMSVEGHPLIFDVCDLNPFSQAPQDCFPFAVGSLTGPLFPFTQCRVTRFETEGSTRAKRLADPVQCYGQSFAVQVHDRVAGADGQVDIAGRRYRSGVALNPIDILSAGLLLGPVQHGDAGVDARDRTTWPDEAASEEPGAAAEIHYPFCVQIISQGAIEVVIYPVRVIQVIKRHEVRVAVGIGHHYAQPNRRPNAEKHTERPLACNNARKVNLGNADMRETSNCEREFSGCQVDQCASMAQLVKALASRSQLQ